MLSGWPPVEVKKGRRAVLGDGAWEVEQKGG